MVDLPYLKRSCQCPMPLLHLFVSLYFALSLEDNSEYMVFSYWTLLIFLLLTWMFHILPIPLCFVLYSQVFSKFTSTLKTFPKPHCRIYILFLFNPISCFFIFFYFLFFIKFLFLLLFFMARSIWVDIHKM